MKILKWFDMHVVLGGLLGYAVAAFITIEGSWVYWYLESVNKLGSLKESDFRIITLPISIVAFIIVFWAFNNKKARKKNFNKINIYLLVSIVIAAVITLIGFLTIGAIFINQQYITEDINIFKMNIISVAVIFASMGLFGGVFVLLIKGRVSYIKFLTKEVKKLESNGFGTVIEVRGKDELAQLCESINSMSVELKERIDKEKQIEKNKNELITNVSHDLRTPLTSIIGYVDLIKNKDYKTEDQFEEYISIIDEKSKSLNKLINELFEYTKLNNHDIVMNFTEVDIVSVCEQIVGEYVYILNKEGLNVEKDIINKEIILNIDIEKMVRVLDNLLSNARKYAVKGSTVHINLFEEEDNVNIAISNKTNEIKAEEVQYLFHRFYKGDKSRSKTESSGLGLSIAKRIVELHEGTISVELNEDIITFNIVLKSNG